MGGFFGYNMLLKTIPHVKYWWECYWERHTLDKYMPSKRGPTWVAFVDSLMEDLYPARNFDE